MKRIRNLFKSTKKQKEEAFNKIYHEHHDFLFGVALNLTCKNQDLAYDLLQESFTKAYKAIDRFDGKNPRAWLKTILRNTYFDHYKKHKKESSSRSYSDFDDVTRTQAAPIESDFTVEDFENLLQVLENDSDSDEWVSPVSSALCGDLVEGLKAIPSQYRTALLLQHVTQLSYDEIADTMECKLGTVMSRLSRARNALKSALIQQDHVLGEKLRILEAQSSNDNRHTSIQKEAG